MARSNPRAGSESGAAEAAGGGVNHDDLVVADFSHGKAAFIGAIGPKAEDAGDADKACVLRQPARAKIAF